TAVSEICRETGMGSERGESHLSMGVAWKANIMTKTMRQSSVLLFQFAIHLRQLGDARPQLVQLAATT
ncbi:hypothetical protein PMAYCL1PPCAC_04301, partial [Pristionchus mayeri]